jgi:hypothetical protein
MPETTARDLFADIERLRVLCADLEDERRALRDRLSQSAEENVALREAALMWIALYERQVNRANTLAKTLFAEARVAPGSEFPT